MSKFKVGDRVRSKVSVRSVVTEGKCYRVAGIDGDILWVTDNDGFKFPLFSAEAIPTISADDTVRLKSGDPFTDGAFTAEVDSVRDDIVLLKIGSWLPVDAVEVVKSVEAVEAWVPEGEGWIEFDGDENPAPGKKVQWLLTDERNARWFSPHVAVSDSLLWEDSQIVAYRVVDPAPVPAAEPAASTDLESLVVTLVADTDDFKAGIDEAVAHVKSALASIDTAAIPATTTDEDFVTVSISGHPVAVADFLAVIR